MFNLYQCNLWILFDLCSEESLEERRTFSTPKRHVYLGAKTPWRHFGHGKVSALVWHFANLCNLFYLLLINCSLCVSQQFSKWCWDMLNTVSKCRWVCYSIYSLLRLFLLVRCAQKIWQRWHALLAERLTVAERFAPLNPTAGRHAERDTFRKKKRSRRKNM